MAECGVRIGHFHCKKHSTATQKIVFGPIENERKKIQVVKLF